MNGKNIKKKDSKGKLSNTEQEANLAIKSKKNIVNKNQTTINNTISQNKIFTENNNQDSQTTVGHQNKKAKTIIITIVITLVVLFFFLFIIVGCTILLFGNNQSNIETGNVAVIPINGEISIGSNGGFFSESTASSTDIVKYIKDADADPSIKAIIIEINSPGGSGVASEEIANALKNTKKLKVAWIREVGASGAYWAASSCDYIIASRFSITGSVGVLSSYIDFAGLMQRYNVSYEKITGGQYKDIGSPYKTLSEDERKILQQKVDLLHYAFLNEIVKNRNLSESEKQEISTALFYTGEEALNLGLIDKIGGKEDVVNYIENKLSIKVKEKYYFKRKGLSDLLNDLMSGNSYQLGRGIGDSFAAKEGIKSNAIQT